MAKPSVLDEFQEVTKKFKCTKERRIFQYIVPATVPATIGDDQEQKQEVQVTITGTMFTLFQDRAFKGLSHLRRGHILEKHAAPGFETLHLEFKAYPKFGNWGERGYSQTLPGPIVLSRKYSGSMIIVCCGIPETLTLTSVSGQKSVTYKHPLGTSYCTSKNGFDNDYSKAARQLLTPDFLDMLRKEHGVHTMVCEIMGLDEHAYAEEPGTHLVVHGITVHKSLETGVNNQKDQEPEKSDNFEELSPDLFPNIAWPERVKPVEHIIFETFDQAVSHFQQENADETKSEWAAQGEGYVALGANGERLKFKFWRYLMHREFRVIREAKACPTVPELLRRFKIMGCTLETREQEWWANALRTWFLAHANEKGPFIADRDAFLAEARLNGFGTNIDENLQRLPLIIALQGVQCSGKSSLRQRLLPYLHWHGSQDEHGSVAALAESLSTALKKHQDQDQVSRFVALVDRCNKTQVERTNLESALNKQCPGLFVLEYVFVPDVPMVELVKRFAARSTTNAGTGHMFSPDTVGMLRGMEILSQSCQEYDKTGRAWNDDLLQTWQLKPLDSGVNDSCLPVQHPARNPKSGKVVYSGFGVILDPCVYGYDKDAQVLKPDSPGKWYGTHVTHTFGPKDPLPEGVEIDITVTGYYERKQETGVTDLCGLTVSYVWQDIPCIGHITLFCAPGVTPKESNDVLTAAMDGTNNLCSRTKLETPYVLRGFSGTWKR